MTKIDLYFGASSPFCRSVQMAAEAVGVELNLIDIHSLPEFPTPEFLRINPQHIIPTIKDGDFVLWESRAILGYLINKYGKNDELYPKDPVKRAIVDQRLYFEMGTFYQRFADYYYPLIKKTGPADPEKYKKIEEAFVFLNTFLENSRYAAGENVTIADFALLASVSSFVDGGPKFPVEKYPNVKRWYEDCKISVPGYDKTVAGLEVFKTYFANLDIPKDE